MRRRCPLVITLLALAFTAAIAAASPSGQPISLTTTADATPAFCPLATPEPLWVDPLVSPTDLLTQTITVYIGNGEAVTVTAESGVFAANGAYNAFDSPARIEIGLLPNTAHHLLVAARVQESEQYGCPFGGYVLSTRSDRFGNELIIQQAATPTATATATAATQSRRFLLPVIIRP